MKNKLIKLLIGFLLIFPFRLPISVLMILGFDGILDIINQPLPKDVICTNVITTKVVYNIALGSWMVYLLEKYSIELMGRKSKGSRMHIAGENPPFFWWTVIFAMLLITFTIIDAVSIYNIFYN